MRFLADESCDFGVVRALRAAGHDVEAVADIAPRADDTAVIALALREERVLLSEDKDFGQLVYAEGRPSAGVVLIRFPARARQRLPEAIVELVRQQGERLAESFAVVSPRRSRIARPPQGAADTAEAERGEGRDLNEWAQIQAEIATCQECCGSWSADVSMPLAVGEIPPPPRRIDILFVGVAPTRRDGRSRGTHFYSESSDALRRGLFSLLTESEFGLALEDRGLRDGNAAFHDAGFFFVHASKIRPLQNDAPPQDTISYCARRHLAAEIQVLRPRGICFLGRNHLSHVVEALFGQPIGATPTPVRLGTWSGLVAVTHQPVRGWVGHTRQTLEHLWRGRPSSSRVV